MKIFTNKFSFTFFARLLLNATISFYSENSTEAFYANFYLEKLKQAAAKKYSL